MNSIIQAQGIHHITLNGADKKTSIDFWQNILGMKFIFEQPNLDDLNTNHLYFDCGDGTTVTVFTNENITSYILGLSSNLELNKNFNLIGSLGFAEGFSYSFATSNLALKLSENFHLFYGIGGYYLSDEKWNPTGLDGNEPSRYDFGMNLGLQLYLTNHLGLIMRYNIIEEKEENISSMSINGLSFGLIIK